ncbi:MAG TPA: crosslink repair DNA glycosylase YcaQ family protein, partial [Gaiellaceae bacterium]|nr:crosslink repair DNA glycosylase YcaQ family protein [Gaiellaceae bacterium]
MTGSRLELTRLEILAFRRQVGALDQRLPPGRRSLRLAAWAGLQDSMPRAALLSIHARVERTNPSTWEDSSLVQLWGPRYSTYVVAARDLAVFSLGRMPDGGATRRVAEEMAARLHSLPGGTRMTDREAGGALGENPNRLRYAALTGTVVIRWEGARAPAVWTVPPPQVDPGEARLELARRYLHVFGPTTPTAFAQWAGIGPREGVSAFEALGSSMTQVRTPIGDAWILSRDEPTF